MQDERRARRSDAAVLRSEGLREGPRVNAATRPARGGSCTRMPKPGQAAVRCCHRPRALAAGELARLIDSSRQAPKALRLLLARDLDHHGRRAQQRQRPASVLMVGSPREARPRCSRALPGALQAGVSGPAPRPPGFSSFSPPPPLSSPRRRARAAEQTDQTRRARAGAAHCPHRRQIVLATRMADRISQGRRNRQRQAFPIATGQQRQQAGRRMHRLNEARGKQVFVRVTQTLAPLAHRTGSR